MAHDNCLIDIQVIQKTFDVPDMMIERIAFGGLLRPPPAAKVHGHHVIIRHESSSQIIPAAAVGGDAMVCKFDREQLGKTVDAGFRDRIGVSMFERLSAIDRADQHHPPPSRLDHAGRTGFGAKERAREVDGDGVVPG